jgi:hypothetical protein
MAVIVTGDEALVAKFKAADAALHASERDWMREAGIIVEEAIEANITAQGLVDEGDLIGSGRVFNQTAHGITVGFGQGLDYAASIENGAVPHVIVAGTPDGPLATDTFSGRTMLSFYWENAGVDFVGPRVMHPGNRPYKFMRNGSQEAMVPLAFMFMERLRAIFGMPL